MRRIKKSEYDSDNIVVPEEGIQLVTPYVLDKEAYAEAIEQLLSDPSTINMLSDKQYVDSLANQILDNKNKELDANAITLPGITVTPYKYKEGPLKGRNINRSTTYDDWSSANLHIRNVNKKIMDKWNTDVLINRMHNTQNKAAKAIAATMGIAAAPAVAEAFLPYLSESQAARIGWGAMGLMGLPDDIKQISNDFETGNYKNLPWDISSTAFDIAASRTGIGTVTNLLKNGKHATNMGRAFLNWFRPKNVSNVTSVTKYNPRITNYWNLSATKTGNAILDYISPNGKTTANLYRLGLPSFGKDMFDIGNGAATRLDATISKNQDYKITDYNKITKNKLKQLWDIDY